MNEQTNIHSHTTVGKSWNGVRNAIDFSFTFAFRSKEQYLIFKRLWKENYAELSRTIRDRKQQVKSTMRKREYAGKLQRELHELKAQATMQLLMLKAAKQEAQRQYLAAKSNLPT